MITEIAARKKRKSYLNNVNLIIIALASGFFPRMLTLIKFPSAVNFLHFAVVFLVFLVTILTSRSKDSFQLKISRNILFSLLTILIVTLISAWLNEAGAINVVLHFLLFNEPVLLLLAIIYIPMSVTSLNRLRAYVFGFGFVNLILALIQKYVLKWDTCNCAPGGWTGPDAIFGVFIDQGAGCIVGASVSMSFSIQFFLTAKSWPLWLRLLVVLAAFVHIIVADAKQVLVIAGTAFGLFSLTKMKNITKGIIYLVAFVILARVFWWAMFNFEFLGAFAGWVRPEIYGPDGEATKFKLFGINTVLKHMNSPLNWLFGLGPGHSIDRIGGWMLRDYANLLNPLGATTSGIGEEVWLKVGKSWLANGSTMFSPFFGWAAIWGDLGFIGIGAYLYLYFLIWSYVCRDDMSRFQIFSVFVVGWIQAGLQEPGFMLFVAALLGLRWQEQRGQYTK